MFSLREFIMKGLKESINYEPNYKVIENATGWLNKGVLSESDLSELNDIMSDYEYSEENIPVVDSIKS